MLVLNSVCKKTLHCLLAKGFSLKLVIEYLFTGVANAEFLPFFLRDSLVNLQYAPKIRATNEPSHCSNF